MQRPVYDEGRRGVFTSTPGLPLTPVYGAEEYRALRDLVGPSLGKRLGRMLPGRADQEKYDSQWIRQSTLVKSLRVTAQFAEATQPRRDGQLVSPSSEPVRMAEPPGITQAVAGAWAAVHFDQVLNDLESRGSVPRGTASDLAFGWDDADESKRQQLMYDVDPMAPVGYAFAEAVARQTELSTDQALHRLNNAPVHEAPRAAAVLLMGGSERLLRLADEDPGTHAQLEDQLATAIKVEFDQLRSRYETGTGPRYRTNLVEQSKTLGEWAADRTIERLQQLESSLDKPAAEPDAKPLTGLAEAAGAPSRTAERSAQAHGHAITQPSKTVEGRG